MIKKSKEKFDSILKKYSPIFGLDLNYFVKGGFWLSLGQASTIIKGFVISVLLANVLSKSVFGQYNFILSLIGLASIFSLPSLGSYVIVSVSNNFHGTYMKAIKESFKFSFLGSLIFIGFSIYGYFIGREYGSIIFLLIALLFPFYSISNYYERFYQGLKNFKSQTIINLIFNFIIIVSLVILLSYSKKLIFIILLFLILQIIIKGYSSIILIKRYIKNNLIDEESIISGKKHSFSSMFVSGALQIDSLFVAYFLGFEELAAFAIIVLLPSYLKTILTTYTPLILPKIANKKEITKKSLFKHSIKLLLILVMIIISYSLFAPFLFKYFYPKYVSYVFWSILFNVSLVSLLSVLYLSYFIKEKKLKIISKINIFSSVFLVICSFILIINFGLIGAIIARMSYRFFSLVLYLFYIRKTYK